MKNGMGEPVENEKTGEDPGRARSSTGFFASLEFDPQEQDLFFDDIVRKRDKWSVSWSDLMMTMFVLFTVLYVYQAGNRELLLGQGPGGSRVGTAEGGGKVMDIDALHNPSDIYDQARQAFMDEFVDDSVGVDMVSDKAVRISIAGDLLFDTGSAQIRP